MLSPVSATARAPEQATLVRAPRTAMIVDIRDRDPDREALAAARYAAIATARTKATSTGRHVDIYL